MIGKIYQRFPILNCYYLPQFNSTVIAAKFYFGLKSFSVIMIVMEPKHIGIDERHLPLLYHTLQS